MLCGVVLATKGASIPKLSLTASTSTAALDNTQERRLRAVTPLPNRAIDRTLPATLGGNTHAIYVWTINDAAYPNRKSLDIRKGERVGIAFTISTKMGHPMHLHGHDFQVVEIDGEKISGALRDTLFVPPRSQMTVAFDADNAGIWPLHCHLLYHLDSGMFTVVKYARRRYEVLATERESQGVYAIELAQSEFATGRARCIPLRQSAAKETFRRPAPLS